jgi:hypothetical protein
MPKEEMGGKNSVNSAARIVDCLERGHQEQLLAEWQDSRERGRRRFAEKVASAGLVLILVLLLIGGLLP